MENYIKEKEERMKKEMPLALLLAVILLMFCSARESAKPSPSAAAATADMALTGQSSTSSNPADPAQPVDKGIGPVKNLKLGPIDEKLAAQGKQLFSDRCAACHALDKDMTGPALGSVLKRRTPEFVMNMILNTSEMEKKNETIMKLISKFSMPMPPPGLTADQARAVLEYFRTTDK
jgi:mono/diheme cytochrome c family protein